MANLASTVGDWSDNAARLLVAVAVLAVGVAYDQTQVMPSTEPRWMLLHVFAFAGATVWSLGRIASGFQPVRSLPIPVWLAAAFGATVLLSTLDAIDGHAGVWQATNIAACLAAFGLTFALRDERWYWAVLWIATAALGANGLLGILQYHGIDDADVARSVPQWAHFGAVIDHFAQLAPPAAFFVNRNIGASFAVLTLPLALGTFLLSRGYLALWLSASCFAVGSVFVVYTHARASWLAGAAALGVLTVFCMVHRPTRRLVLSRFPIRRAVPAVLAVSAIVFLVLQPTALIGGGGYTAKLSGDVGEQIATVADVGGGSAAMRLAHYMNGSRMALDYWFNGVGVGSFRAAYPLYHDSVVDTPQTAYSPRVLFRHVHNDFLQAFVELGAVGGVLFVVILLAVLFAGLRVVKQDQSEERRLIALACSAALGGVMVSALFSFPFQTPTAGLAWTVAGMLVGVGALARNGAVRSALPASRMSRSAAVAVAAGSAALFVGVALDDLARRESGVHLKWAWSRNFHGVELDEARADADRAAAIHSRSSLLQETRALVYLNDTSPSRPPPDQVFDVVSESLQSNPNSSYLLIGLGKLTVYKGLRAKRTGDEAGTRAHAEQAAEIAARLRRVAGFRSETEATAGYAFYLKGDLDAARRHFDKAAEIDPESRYVRRGQALIRVRNLIDKALDSMDQQTGKPGDASGTPTPGKDP